MAFPTGPVNGQVYIALYGTRYVYMSDTNRWVKQGAPVYGSTGSQGAAGAGGLTGGQGLTGIPGVTGAQGLIGSQGPTGGPGLQGATGSIGPQGIEGSQGLAGSFGSATGILGFNFDGNGRYLTNGLQVSAKVPYNISFDGWEVTLRETGVFSCDVRSGSYNEWPVLNSLSGATGPYATMSARSSLTGLSSWTSRFVTGTSFVQAVLSGCTGVRSASLSIKYHRE